MFSKSEPFQQKSAMHLKHLYKNCQFTHVCQAFLQKYNAKNQWCTSTICHVEQLDADRFQFVRRMENVFTSTPIYEKIVVDRKELTMQGFTFEKPQDQKYSEHYTYSHLDGGNVNYSMLLFRDPGLKRIIRGRAHNWGVDSLMKLIAVQ